VPPLVRIIRYLLLCLSESALSRILRPVWYVLVALVEVGSLLPGDKFHHFTAYAAPGSPSRAGMNGRRSSGSCWCSAVLGVLLEFSQLYSPGRSYDVYDMLADGLGILVGFTVGLPFRFTLDSGTSEHP
jgi:hypothetical protein